ncbi:hybrid sensor histidine kinase/response regulator [Eisenibacter elegans]|jgi:signal transduction histidine kinase|uniref:hybrid sensor histidine kinase/response regulator n=1 Tax=Eisenibacter elegans TaxID=997 RepID=UPI00040E924C|nr:hybrid sensor histidine kinase/response regulator [Eisenibacter elegans]
MKTTKDAILYVDDEPKNLSSFKAVFRRDYDVLTATSATEGLAILADKPVQLVITDQRMPNVTGVEFLEKIARLYPEITRIILTGYSDVEAIINAINKGKVYRYVTKPWQLDNLRETIDQALETYHLRAKNEALLEELKKTNAELDRFVYSASHDLRAPVASLLGLINLAKRETDAERMREYFLMQEGILQRLDSFISDIAEFSRNSRTEIQLEKIELQRFIQEIWEQHRYHIDAQKIDFRCYIDAPVYCYSDLTRLAIICNNLISNAVRYYDPAKSQPFIQVNIRQTAEATYLSVADNGIGIEEAHLPHIFDMFYRATDQRNGSGLGLFLVKESLEKLNGSITASSTPTKGALFQVLLPHLQA